MQKSANNTKKLRNYFAHDAKVAAINCVDTCDPRSYDGFCKMCVFGCRLGVCIAPAARFLAALHVNNAPDQRHWRKHAPVCLALCDHLCGPRCRLGMPCAFPETQDPETQAGHVAPYIVIQGQYPDRIASLRTFATKLVHVGNPGPGVCVVEGSDLLNQPTPWSPYAQVAHPLFHGGIRRVFVRRSYTDPGRMVVT